MTRISCVSKLKSIAILSTILLLIPAGLFGQGPSKTSFEFSYDYFPYQKLSEAEQGTFYEDLEIRVQKFNFEISHPLVFSRGRTILINNFGYQRLEIDYMNWDEVEGRDEPRVDDLHALSYTLFVRRVIDNTWSMAFLFNPGIASDFKGALMLEDFSLQFGAIFSKQFSSKFALGFGAIYSTQFGHPIPLPALSFQWNNGSNLRANVIIPVNMEFWYDASERIDLGVLMKIDGNEFHADPEIYGYDNPNFRFADAMIGPAAEMRMLPWMKVNLYGGYTYLRYFEFYNNYYEIAGYDPNNSLFFRAGLTFER
ncbi:MAG: hypothetical protein GWO10_08915 [candidate division Zixibacteria bacterium]|nr:hypothetical protein [candidate division Zixibacteria bacterium]